MDALLTTLASLTALYASALFFMTGLLTGAWKYVEMTKSKEYRAPFYVDVAHRASLLYAFAAMLVAIFAYYSAQSSLPATVTLLATVAPLLFFGLSIALYVVLGLKNETNNQLRDDKAPALTLWFMRGLMLGEIGGFSVLFYGFWQTANQIS
ncbi:MAG: hypothetical protein ACRBBW_07370 [Cellvibrionaceae bacterium]